MNKLFAMHLEQARELKYDQHKVIPMRQTENELIKLRREYSFEAVQVGQRQFFLFTVDHDFYIYVEVNLAFTRISHILADAGEWRIIKSTVSFA